MNKLSRILTAILLVGSVPFSVHAQSEDDLVRFLQAGQEDGGKLITAYINPFVEGFSYALNGGWFHTAKPHKLGGFDFNFSVTPVFVPKSTDFFNPASLNLTTVTGFTNVTNPGGAAPTIFGPKDQTRYQVDIDDDGQPDATIDGPRGLGIRETIKLAPVGTPMAQVGLGLIKGTDLMFRFIPKTSLGSTAVNLIGFGLRHDIKQHIPGIKMLPFDLSVMAGFTSFKGVTDLSGSGFAGANQEAEYKFNAFLLQALVSKKLAFVTFFGGFGYNGVKTTADMKGTYTFFEGQATEFTLSDPYSATFKNNSMRMDVGMRINILAFYLYGNYSLQAYSAVTAGLGFTFR